jgi:DNA modification methylase
VSAQLARFVFQLRRNIVIEGDCQLAELELGAFLPGELVALDDLTTAAAESPALRALHGFGTLGRHSRPQGRQGYVATGPLSLLPELIRRLSFIQRLYCVTDETEAARQLVIATAERLGPVIAWQAEVGRLVIQAVPHYAVIELSEVVARQSSGVADMKRNLDALVAALLDCTTEHHPLQLVEKAINAGSTTAHLSHDIHYYKAKFFPRMVRSLLNVCSQRVGPGPHRAIDNFAGSGTSLLEASLLGIPSVGLDLDPLSVIIAKAKLEVLHLDADYLASEATKVFEAIHARMSGQLALFGAQAADLPDEDVIFPAWLMKNRRMSAAIAKDLNREIQTVRAGVAAGAPDVQNVLRVLMSDAIARKIRMRFLGTGVGRFALSFAVTSMVKHFSTALAQYVKVAATCEWLRETLRLQLADAQVVTADTRRIPEELGLFDILVTSPPYMPASSGRESYAKARAPSLIAMGMRRHDDIDLLADESIGSMEGNGVALDQLRPEERTIVDWLATDELRAIKAAPSARYFLDMRATFAEMRRVLSPGALAVVVSGKQSTFYQFSTRTALHVVEAAKILATEAESVGFAVESLIDVQLNKSNRNARPRSLDDYYETLIVLKQPAGSRPAGDAS